MANKPQVLCPCGLVSDQKPASTEDDETDQDDANAADK